MARPAKAVATKTGKIGNEEQQKRLQIESKLKGGREKLVPPLYLTDDQMQIFNYIMDELEEANILGNLDLFVLSQTAICVDRVQKLEKEINDNPDLIRNNAFMAGKDKYSKDFFRCCNELCLSPQSRAKLSIATVKPGAEKKKTIMDLLNEEDDDE
ncbi:MAG: P27 family phage terminase small subunit [Clostridiales bacterium]|nr:P27 family phage terminase small subunit [Clostridiales bacterium]